ncbi:ion channel [Aliiglaciecola sp. LCG003]|uniref:ion channel n=1 Tax=Aliiglaciecola sp. LCG003 TaxID=3053655 RepID=UPI0025726869|nr:ion channel [Aliiglaciecola sp. LCG003]WJG09282.1 ion channel [Aliiglaciecola sp. LCG003]
MLVQLLLGAAIITLTIIVQVVILGVLAYFFARVKHAVSDVTRSIRNITIMVVSVLWLVLGITINTWIWALTFIYIGEFADIETAVYFAISSFTTLGYGDILMSEKWRILGSLSAVNGLIVFGLNTAFLVELMISTWGKSRLK